jgi:DNA replication and repair protein RecF
MQLQHLWLTDFRSYREAELSPSPEGITVITGANGEGKTNLLEAIGYLATLRSLRGSPPDAMVRDGAESGRAIVRAEGQREGRRLLVEAELRVTGRDRVQIGGQPLRRARDLLGAFQVTVFAPDDLTLVKGAPQGRREFLDGLLVALHPRHDATITEVERVLKQRNALLKTAGPSVAAGRSAPAEITATLDVWDAKLTAASEALVAARRGLVAALEPLVGVAYGRLATAVAHRGRAGVGLAYQCSWASGGDGVAEGLSAGPAGGLAAALAAARRDDLRRGVTTVGPHRDELSLRIGDLPARTHASQGEQRSLALALRLAGHELVTHRIGSAPILLLDDVFSELDPVRGEALMGCLPAGQALVTTAGDLPAGVDVAARARVEDGKLLT